jgi:hypothetical protein
MAQDGSGYSLAHIGNGDIIPAKIRPRPDKIKMMMQMADMDMRMGAPAMKWNPNEEEPYELMKNWGMDMSGMNMSDARMMNEHVSNDRRAHKSDEMKKTDRPDKPMSHASHSMPMKDATSDTMQMNHTMHNGGGMEHSGMFSEYNYDYLQSPTSTVINEEKPVQKVLLNLTGNMWRYIWSMNGVPLSEADMIKINKGSKVQITFNNLTMMHHPMHLHGHFFRVINKHGARSPLKHTVNVAPMQKTVIEFDATEDSDWFLHCHVLYHMMGGMARALSYGTQRNPQLTRYPRKILFGEGNHFYTWGLLDVGSHMTGINLVSSNIRNQFNLNAEVGYNENLELEVSYERYLYDYFSVFIGANGENAEENSWDDLEIVGIAGFRFFTPYMFNLDFRIDHNLRPELRLGRELMIFPRLMLFGRYEYQADFGITTAPTDETTGEPVSYMSETVWAAGLEYLINRNISLMGNYDNRFGAGGGLSVRF